MFETKYLYFDYSGDGTDLADLFKEENHLFFLDSSYRQGRRGRFSMIGFDPFLVCRGQGGNSLEQLRKQFVPFLTKSEKQIVPFESGIVGCLSYDYGLYQENIESSAVRDLFLPDSLFGFYDFVITIDHWEKKLIITSTGLPETQAEAREARARKRLQDVEKKIASRMIPSKEELTQRRFAEEPSEEGDEEITLTGNFTYEQYLKAIQKAQQYIAEGEIYQVNLSQRFVFDPAGSGIDPHALYRMLRDFSPCDFGGYFDGGDFQILSNSPERFLTLEGRTVQTSPMKGTRPRGKNPQEDEKLLREFICSKKDQAELLMITDLSRNDIGKVCEYGSVHVKNMRTIEKYKTVFQATSTIEGTLKNRMDAFDLISACFPGGSIVGCPKIRAMEIIEELEPTKRSFYTGTLGYVSFSGNMDFNILIRTLLSCQGKYCFQVGGGIVADSNAEDEYEETMVKAQAIKSCLKKMAVLSKGRNKVLN